MDIIPAIDLINGQCVRLSGGDFARQTTYAADPLAVAQRFEQAGVRRLHVVDLDGARAGQLVTRTLQLHVDARLVVAGRLASGDLMGL